MVIGHITHRDRSSQIVQQVSPGRSLLVSRVLEEEQQTSHFSAYRTPKINSDDLVPAGICQDFLGAHGTRQNPGVFSASACILQCYSLAGGHISRFSYHASVSNTCQHVCRLSMACVGKQLYPSW